MISDERLARIENNIKWLWRINAIIEIPLLIMILTKLLSG